MFEEIVSLIEAVIWPSTVVLLALMFRNHTISLLKALTKLKWNDLEVEFSEQLRLARDTLDASSDGSDSALSASLMEFDLEAESVVEKLASLSPRSVIMEAWLAVEGSISEAARFALSTEPSNNQTSSVLAKKLHDVGYLNMAEFEAFNVLKNVRNRAIHEMDFSISQSDAVEFAIMARKIVRSFRNKVAPDAEGGANET